MFTCKTVHWVTYLQTHMPMHRKYTRRKHNDRRNTNFFYKQFNNVKLMFFNIKESKIKIEGVFTPTKHDDILAFIVIFLLH